jgi:ABC-type Na+ transport system ATPase subunit NatA
MKKTSKTPKKQNKVQREIGVLIEHFESKLDLSLEQHLDTNKKIDTLSKRMDTLEEHTARISVDMTIVKQQMQIINAGFKRKVELEEFEALESRVAALEKRK